MNILGWPGWQIVSVTDRGQEYLIEAERSTLPAVCIHCGSDQLYRHDRKSQLFLDVPLWGKRCGILVCRRRLQCQSCQRSFFEPLSEMHPEHFMTQRLVDYIEQQALRHTF